MNPSTLLKRLIFVPSCASCGTRLSPFPDEILRTHGKVCLCGECYKAWMNETSMLCDKCALPAYKCTCIPKALQEKNISAIPAICFYKPDENSVQNKMIYSLKKVRHPDLIDYLTFELYPHVVNEINHKNISRDSLIFTWVPRRRSAISKYGFDQGELLSKSLAKLFGVQAVPLFLRIGGKEQKKLDAKERAKNLERSLILNHNLIGFPTKELRDDLSLILEGKNVVIVDDIVTTGSTAKYAIDKLSTIWDGNVIVTAVARANGHLK